MKLTQKEREIVREFKGSKKLFAGLVGLIGYISSTGSIGFISLI